MSDEEVDFDFIYQVAQKITDFLLNDPEREEWYSSVVNYYEEKEQFPENTIKKITDYLIDDKEYVSLVDDVNSIVAQEENTDNLLSSIFFPPSEEETQIESEEQVLYIIPEEEEEDKKDAIDNHNPQSYFDHIIHDLMFNLYLSHDIAYVLLKKFSWNKEKLSQEWFSRQKEILDSLHIKIKSKMVPDQKSPLSIKKSGKGECPICLDVKELYELYCGHKLCKECLTSEIIHQIDSNNIAVCRQDCGAEIMPKEVQKFISPQQFEKYQKLVLKREIILDPTVKECPNGDCNCIITTLDSLPCHVGRCPCCNSVVCLRCDRGAHAPLISCDTIDDFSTKISEQMTQLEQDQEAWFKREAELQSYRRQHIDEVKHVFDQGIKSITDRHQKLASEEQQRIDEVAKEADDLQTEISILSRKISQLRNDRKSPAEVEKLTRELDTLHERYNQRSGYKERLQRDKKVNDSERRNELETAKKEERLFLDAIKDQSMYQRKMYEFEMSLNTRAYQNVAITSNDDDLVSTMTKKCPKCHTPIERNDGCNHMTCQICHYQFCYVCEEPWETHSNYYICPKYKKNVVIKNRKGKSQCGIDFNDKNDKKFYPLPMTIEKREDYMRWNNLYTKFRMQKERYDELYKELYSKEEPKPENPKDEIPLFKLCPINRIVKILKLSYNDQDSKERAIKILNNILFAHSVVMWGYPSLYYMMKEPRKASVFEYKISKIDENKNNLLQKIREANPNSTASDLIMTNDVLNSSIMDVLEMAETFA